MPDDRQVLVLYLPIDGGKNRYLKAAARNTAAAGSAGMPHKFMIAHDDASQKVIDVLTDEEFAAQKAKILSES